MKKNATQQEIILVTGTTFSSRNWCRRDEPAANEGADQLEEACWNGMLPEMLPEIFEVPARGNKIFLWQIRQGDGVLELDLGSYPEARDAAFSIDAYLYLSTQPNN